MSNFNIEYKFTTLSDLLRRVVSDMRFVKERYGVEFDMDEWVSTTDDGRCAVCAAGAFVLAECYPDGIDDAELMHFNRNIIRTDIRDGDADVLLLIDDIRQGYPDDYLCDSFGLSVECVDLIRNAFTRLKNSHDYDEDDYHDVVKWFNSLATILEKNGY